MSRSPAISARLDRLAHDEGVRVLLAVEAGSRSWGFPSPQSDFDVRFVYARPLDAYLTVDPDAARDVIEVPAADGVELVGWDVRKALRLLGRSNPSMVEWLCVGPVYAESGGFAKAARALLPEAYVPEAAVHHLRSVAQTNLRRYLSDPAVPHKVYLHTARPLLSIRWIERHRSPPPVALPDLLPLLDDASSVRAALEELIVRKARERLPTAPPIPHLQAFVEAELARLVVLPDPPPRRDGLTARLDALFRTTLRELHPGSGPESSPSIAS